MQVRGWDTKHIEAWDAFTKNVDRCSRRARAWPDCRRGDWPSVDLADFWLQTQPLCAGGMSRRLVQPRICVDGRHPRRHLCRRPCPSGVVPAAAGCRLAISPASGEKQLTTAGSAGRSRARALKRVRTDQWSGNNRPRPDIQMQTELNLKKTDLIRRLVEAGYGEELRLILFGASRFNRPEFDDESDVKYPAEWVHYEGRLHLVSLVQAHLEFTSMFGRPFKLQAWEHDTTSLTQRSSSFGLAMAHPAYRSLSCARWKQPPTSKSSAVGQNRAFRAASEIFKELECCPRRS